MSKIKQIKILLMIITILLASKLYYDYKLKLLLEEVDQHIVKVKEIYEERNDEVVDVSYDVESSKIEDLIYVSFNKIVFIYSKNGEEVFVEVKNWMRNTPKTITIKFFGDGVTIYTD